MSNPLLSILSNLFDGLSSQKGPLSGLLSSIFGAPAKGGSHSFSSLFGDNSVPGAPKRSRDPALTPFSNPQPQTKQPSLKSP